MAGDIILPPEKKQDIADSITDGEILSCNDVQPPDTEFVGEGAGRCVFETDDAVIKVAKNHEGLSQNRGAEVVHDRVDGVHTDAFAMPQRVYDPPVAVVQEKVTPYTDIPEEDRSLPKRAVRPRVEGKMDAVLSDRGVQCEDVVLQNIGVKNGEFVLLDLGECTEFDPHSG